jgi:hypothetical protein
MFAIMKKKFSELLSFRKLSLLIFILFIFSSCEYENSEVNALEKPVSYSEVISPLINKKCALAGCHIDHATIGDFKEYSEIKSRIVNGKFQLMVFEYKLMPPLTHRSLSDLELTKLKKWVEEGAKNY